MGTKGSPVPDITSPFSDSWGQHQLRVDDLPWRKHTSGRLQGKWVRALWGSEMYQERRSSTAGRAEDIITVAKMNLPASLSFPMMVDAIRLACMHERFIHPVLAITIETNVFPISLMPCLVYEEVPFSTVQTWADCVVYAHECDTDAERAQTVDERILDIRNRIGTRPLPVTQHTREWHLIRFGRPEDAHKVALMMYSAHSVSDAHSEIMLMRELLEYTAKALAEWPLPASHPLHPSQCPWGKEVDRLPLSLMQMMGIPLDAFNIDFTVERAAVVLSAPHLRLDEGRPIADAVLTNTLHKRVVFTEEETRAIHRTAKAHGWSVTQIIDAARHMAYMQARRSYLEAWHWRPIPEGRHINFLVPMNARKYFTDPYKKWEHTYAGNATEGFITVLPLMDPYFIPAEEELASPHMSNKGLSALSQVRTLAYVTQKLHDVYQQKQALIMKRQETIIPVCVFSGIFSPEYPFDVLSPEGFSSIGAIDSTMPSQVSVPGHGNIEVADWWTGLVMSRHRSSVQFAMHVWTFRGQLNLSVVYTPHMGKERTAQFLDHMRANLKLFVMAYEQHGKPIDIPTTPPTPFTPPTLFQYVYSWLQSWWR